MVDALPYKKKEKGLGRWASDGKEGRGPFRMSFIILEERKKMREGYRDKIKREGWERFANKFFKPDL
jgi:hypothetical protein